MQLTITDRQNNAYERMLAVIKQSKAKAISFSIFDTLILRPFLYPADLFFLMEKDFSNICKNKSFLQVRVQAEKNARKNDEFSQPDINAVYSELQKISGISEEESEKLMGLEFQLEMKFCRPRECGVKLLSEAVRTGRKIVLTDDTYFTRDMIEKILKKCGISGYKMIFVSSETGLNKSGGDMYPHIAKRLKLNSYEILHIGSNLQSDIEQAINQGTVSLYLPSCREQLFKNGRLCGYIYSKAGKKINTSKYFSLRCLMGMYALYAFDYPSSEPKKGDFCENERFMGFIVLGGIYMNSDFKAAKGIESAVLAAMRENDEISAGENDFAEIYSGCFGNILEKSECEGCILPFRLLFNHAGDTDRELLKSNLSDSDYQKWGSMITEPDITADIQNKKSSEVQKSSDNGQKNFLNKFRKRKK